MSYRDAWMARLEHAQRTARLADARRARVADARTWAGFRMASRARSTGALIVLVDGYAQGLATEGDGDGRWFLICDAHGSILSDEVQAVLIPHMASPQDWCDGCRSRCSQ